MRLKKKEWAIIAGMILALFGVAWAIDESVTVSSTSKALTTANYSQFQRAMITVETAAIRFTLDGVTTPTDAVGIKLNVGENLFLPNQDLISKFRAIRLTATNATLKVTYW